MESQPKKLSTDLKQLKYLGEANFSKIYHKPLRFTSLLKDGRFILGMGQVPQKIFILNKKDHSIDYSFKFDPYIIKTMKVLDNGKLLVMPSNDTIQIYEIESSKENLIHTIPIGSRFSSVLSLSQNKFAVDKKIIHGFDINATTSELNIFSAETYEVILNKEFDSEIIKMYQKKDGLLCLFLKNGFAVFINAVDGNEVGRCVANCREVCEVKEGKLLVSKKRGGLLLINPNFETVELANNDIGDVYSMISFDDNIVMAGNGVGEICLYDYVENKVLSKRKICKKGRDRLYPQDKYHWEVYKIIKMDGNKFAIIDSDDYIKFYGF